MWITTAGVAKFVNLAAGLCISMYFKLAAGCVTAEY